MGICCGVSGVSINLHQENSFYCTDENISGIVNWNNNTDGIRLNEIYILLKGEISYTTEHISRNGRGIRKRTTKYHRTLFYSTKFSFVKPQPQEDMLVLNREQYSWPFQLSLTKHLPPTINAPQSYPNVRYYLQVVIDRPWYKPNIRELRYLTIYPRLNVLQNPQCLQSIIFKNENRKEMTLKGSIHKKGYVPGESINLTLEIENPKQVSIRLIDLFIFQSYKIEGNTDQYKLFQTTLPNIQNIKDREIRGTFFVTIPSILLPPSYHFHGVIQKSISINIHYFIRLVVKVEGIFTNLDIDIPIIIGTEPGLNLNQQLLVNPQIVPHSSNDDQPPSYDSVVEDIK